MQIMFIAKDAPCQETLKQKYKIKKKLLVRQMSERWIHHIAMSKRVR